MIDAMNTTRLPEARHAATARQLTVAARSMPRDPRSPEYWQGVEAAAARALARIAGETLPRFVIPYQMGTTEADAFLSGIDEGRRIAERSRAEEAPTP